MRAAAVVLSGVLGLACTACGKNPSATGPGGPVEDADRGDRPPPGGGAILLNLRSTVGGNGGELKHSLKLDGGGEVVFRVTSEGPFAVTVMTDKGRLLVEKKGRAALNPSEVLLAADGQPPAYEGRVTVPAGRVWFVIENKWTASAPIRLQCFEGR